MKLWQMGIVCSAIFVASIMDSNGAKLFLAAIWLAVAVIAGRFDR
jgi:hypothetical protein